MSPFLLENMLVLYSVLSNTHGKFYKRKLEKKKGKVCKKIPFCPTHQEFRLEYNVGIFAPKLADRIFSGPRKNWKIC